ncbi:MAG: arylformamidase [Patiriisocius sp.]|jgi:arylformamidase
MLATIKSNNTSFTIDLLTPLDISIVLTDTPSNPLAWYIGKPDISPVKLGDWVGKVSQGAAVNFNNISFNPHAHGTHTECLGHITNTFYSVNDALSTFFFIAEIITITPTLIGEDHVLRLEDISRKLQNTNAQAVVIRTLPNTGDKTSRKYSNTNWPYLDHKAAAFLRDLGVQHLLIDLPSVDKEKDDGALLAHKAFWNIPEAPRKEATITEFVYVPDTVKDGAYVLNLQVAPFENDAAPSRPVLYKIA